MCSNVKDLRYTHHGFEAQITAQRRLSKPKLCVVALCKRQYPSTSEQRTKENRGNMNFDQTDDSLVGLVNFPGIFTSRFIFRRQTLLMFLFGGFDSTKK